MLGYLSVVHLAKILLPDESTVEGLKLGLQLSVLILLKCVHLLQFADLLFSPLHIGVPCLEIGLSLRLWLFVFGH